jgi:hypothetical protein
MERVDYQPIIVQDLINWEKSNELNISPWYQRRSVWTNAQKAYLINTLFEQKPVPTIYFRHTVDLAQDKSIREVVDGQQRIRTMLEYVAGDYAAQHAAHQKKVKYSDLTDTQKRAFRETKLSGGFLLGASDADVIEIFGRLNSVAKTLNAQEKRNAMYSGELKQFCLRQAAEKVHLWRDLKIFSANDIARMQEVEFLSDLVLNLVNGLSDFSAARLDRLYAENEDNFPGVTRIAKRLETIFSSVAALPAETISETIFSRQPIFFSLALAIDEHGRVGASKLNDALLEMDARYRSDRKTKRDEEFYDACQASTQRISTRKVRHSYIKSFLG